MISDQSTGVLGTSYDSKDRHIITTKSIILVLGLLSSSILAEGSGAVSFVKPQAESECTTNMYSMNSVIRLVKVQGL